MFHGNSEKSLITILALSLNAVIALAPLSVFGQRDKKSAKAEAEKPAPEETARQQPSPVPSPVPVKQDESKKPEQAASEEESKPRDPNVDADFQWLEVSLDWSGVHFGPRHWLRG